MRAATTSSRSTSATSGARSMHRSECRHCTRSAGWVTAWTRSPAETRPRAPGAAGFVSCGESSPSRPWVGLVQFSPFGAGVAWMGDGTVSFVQSWLQRGQGRGPARPTDWSTDYDLAGSGQDGPGPDGRVTGLAEPVSAVESKADHDVPAAEVVDGHPLPGSVLATGDEGRPVR